MATLAVLILALASIARAKFTLLPIPTFGAEVRDLKVVDIVDRLLGSESDRETALQEIEELRRALHKERLLVFRSQGDIPWQKQVTFSSQFGSVFNESSHVNRERHAAIPDDQVAIFSNDPNMGASGVGVEGWHVDGNVVPVPHAITFIHAVSAIEGGDTSFVPLREVVQYLRENGYLRGTCVERAPPCSVTAGGIVSSTSESKTVPLDDAIFKSAHVDDVLHPLIYPHPVTGLDTMMFGLGQLSGRFHRGSLQPSQTPRTSTAAESAGVKGAIEKAIHDVKALHWRWADGDLVMVDNRAVAHLASSGTQSPPSDVGLRLMRRTTVQSRDLPRKRPLLHTLPHECVTEGVAGGSDHYCMFSLANEMNYSDMQFDSREIARQRCKVLSPDADLAIPLSQERNQAAGRIVSSVGHPHWIGADDYPNGHVTWLDQSAVPGWGANEQLPWHGPSGQPNDCDGPESEQCIFMGPNAKWFDFECGPKMPGLNMYNKTVTPGPEVVWEDGIRRMYNVFPLCGLSLSHAEAPRLGLRMVT